MKLTLHLKDPDGVYESGRDAVCAEVAQIPGLDAEECETLARERHEALDTALSKWVREGEYVDIEIDTAADTARVVEQKEI